MSELLRRSDMVILIRVEQVEYEISRALDNMIVTGAITVEPKPGAIRAIYRDYRDFINNCIESQQAQNIERLENRIVRTASLGRQLERCRLKFRGNVGSDLILVAVAEEGAAILTSDAVTMYRAYRECLPARKDRNTLNVPPRSRRESQNSKILRVQANHTPPS